MYARNEKNNSNKKGDKTTQQRFRRSPLKKPVRAHLELMKLEKHQSFEPPFCLYA